MKTILLQVLLAAFCLSAMAQTKTENLILVTLDGLRWQEVFNGADSNFINNKNLVEDPANVEAKYGSDDLDKRRHLLMPFLWTNVAAQGQVYGNRDKNCLVNVQNPHWFSYPGYNEILTGFADPKVNSNDYGPNPHESMFEFLNKKPEFKGKIAAFASWDAFNNILNEGRSGIYVSSGFEPVSGCDDDSVMAVLNRMQNQLPDVFGGVRLDAVTFNMGFEYLKTKQPRVLFLAFDETDDFAHAGRYADYLNSAHAGDAFLSELWAWVQSNPHYQNKTTLLVTCDHGRGEGPEKWRDHGEKTENSSQTWFAVIGPDTPALGEVNGGQYYNNQFAKTMAALLGVNFESPDPIGATIEPVVEVKTAKK